MEEGKPDSKDKLNLEFKGKDWYLKFIYEGLGKTLFGVLIILTIGLSIYKGTFDGILFAFCIVGLALIMGYMVIQKKI